MIKSKIIKRNGGEAASKWNVGYEQTLLIANVTDLYYIAYTCMHIINRMDTVKKILRGWTIQYLQKDLETREIVRVQTVRRRL